MANLSPIGLQKALKGVDSPATNDDLMKAIERNGAQETAPAPIDAVEDGTCETPADVTAAVVFGGDDR